MGATLLSSIDLLPLFPLLHFFHFLPLPLLPPGVDACSSVTTFNAGLTTNYTQRLPVIIKELRRDSADLLCLQEVWLQSDLDILTSHLSDIYSHTFSGLHASPGLRDSPSPRAACTHAQLQYFTGPVLTCGDERGCLKSVFDTASMACLASRCSHLLQRMTGRHCLACISLMGASVTEWAMNCGPNPTRGDNAFNPAGLVMLSKQPMVYATHQSFFPAQRPLVDRGYLEAAVVGVGKVACTHLTPVTPLYLEFDPALPFNSSTQQQAAEIQHLTVKLHDTDHVVLGDLNTGARVRSNSTERNLTAAAPQNLQLLLSAGYRSPYYAVDGRCSYCRSNPLSRGAGNLGIDHVLLRGDSLRVAGAGRVMDQATPTPCSGHFGVKVDVCPKMEMRVV